MLGGLKDHCALVLSATVWRDCRGRRPRRAAHPPPASLVPQASFQRGRVADYYPEREGGSAGSGRLP